MSLLLHHDQRLVGVVREVRLGDAEAGLRVFDDKFWQILRAGAAAGIGQSAEKLGAPAVACGDDRARPFGLDAKDPKLATVVTEVPLRIRTFVAAVLIRLGVDIAHPCADAGLEMETAGYVLDEQFARPADDRAAAVRMLVAGVVHVAQLPQNERALVGLSMKLTCT